MKSSEMGKKGRRKRIEGIGSFRLELQHVGPFSVCFFASLTSLDLQGWNFGKGFDAHIAKTMPSVGDALDVLNRQSISYKY